MTAIEDLEHRLDYVVAERKRLSGIAKRNLNDKFILAGSFASSGAMLAKEELARDQLDQVMPVLVANVDRAVHGGEFLERLHPVKPLHRAFSSSEWLVGILDPVVQPASGLLATGGANRLQRGAIGPQAVGHDGAGAAMAFHCFLDEFQRRSLVPRCGDEGLQHLALVIDGAPEVRISPPTFT